jgi:hypothetical protein
MPLVGHPDEGQDADRVLHQGFSQHAQEGIVIGRLLEQRQAGHGAVQRVVNEAATGIPGSAGHGADPDRPPGVGQKNELSSLFFRVRCFQPQSR